MAKKTKQDETKRERELDLELDQELEGTFPASDPLKITRKSGPKKSTSQPRR